MKKKSKDNYYRLEYQEELPNILNYENLEKGYIEYLVNTYILKQKLSTKLGIDMSICFLLGICCNICNILSKLFVGLNLSSISLIFLLGKISYFIISTIKYGYDKRNLKGNDSFGEIEQMILELIQIKAKKSFKNDLEKNKEVLTDKLNFLKIKRDNQRKYDFLYSKFVFVFGLSSILRMFSNGFTLLNFWLLSASLLLYIIDFGERKARNFKSYEIKEIAELERKLIDIEKEIINSRTNQQRLEQTKEIKYVYKYTPSNVETKERITTLRNEGDYSKGRRIGRCRRTITGYYNYNNKI